MYTWLAEIKRNETKQLTSHKSKVCQIIYLIINIIHLLPIEPRKINHRMVWIDR